MNKIIFLDINGVVLTIPPDGHFEVELEPSANAISNLNLLVQVTGAEVVVTSTWRIGRTVDELESLLKSWGYRGSVLDKTKNGDGDEDRGYDIRNWLSRHEVESFVVIDDDRTDLEEFARHLVSPRPDVGLQLHDVSEAVRILSEVA